MILGANELSQSASEQRRISEGQWNPYKPDQAKKTGIAGKWIFANSIGRSPITNEVLTYTTVYTLKNDGTVNMGIIDNKTNIPVDKILNQSDPYQRINGRIETDSDTKKLSLVFTEVPADQG